MERRIHAHPLAYLLGLQGIALLRAFAGEHDLAFTLVRLDEVRDLLARADELGDGVEARPISTQEGYATWAESYDEPGNALLELEEPVVRAILGRLPTGVALDAACGTARHGAYLAERGHRVIGVDSSPEMLDVARRKLPDAEFHQAELDALPVGDESVDLVVCAIALSHVRYLEPVFAEFVRVLRPGGHLVISDSRGIFADIGLPLIRELDDGTFGYMPTWARLASDYLAAALPFGLLLRACEEIRQEGPIVGGDGTDIDDGSQPPPHRPGWASTIWSLHPYCPAATNAAWLGKPRAIVFDFEKS